MERKRLSSSTLAAAGYDVASRIMEIEFTNGDVYAFHAVSSEVYRQLMATPSPNSFYEDKIDEQYIRKLVGKVSGGKKLDPNDFFAMPRAQNGKAEADENSPEISPSPAGRGPG